jgi:hypothetical protein
MSSLPRPFWMPRHITDEQYAHALRAHLQGCDYGYLAEQLAIPKTTVLKLTRTPEWNQAAKFFREEVRDQQAVFAAGIANVALQKTYDALMNGEEKMTKSGSKVRVQVGAKDAAQIALAMSERVDKLQRQQDGKPEPLDVDSLKQLFKVAEALTDAGKTAMETMDSLSVIDVVPTVDDE